MNVSHRQRRNPPGPLFQGGENTQYCRVDEVVRARVKKPITQTLICFLVSLTCIACTENTLSPPEIYLDINILNLDLRSINPDLDPYEFHLQIYNVGDEVLKIDSVKLRGDQYCALTFEGPDRMELKKNEASFIRFWYKPQVAADDQIALTIVSNAENYPTLIVPICGRGVLPETEDPGQKPVCNIPPSDQLDCPTR
ncbi:MAG: hypothetical protein GY847_37280 [Proteobacteria bacterium]|nr:hypothetical protein [Pseudomonadota bacterium]